MPSTHHKTRNVVTHTKMVFNRQEVKFFVPLNMVDVVVAQLDNYMHRDYFSKNGYYDIYSIYFDTQDWQAFYAKLSGNIHRKKLRLRTYNNSPEPNEYIFAEIKEKDNTEVLKRRTAITLNEAHHLNRGRQKNARSNVYDEWRYSMLRNSLRPKLLNRYKRLAFYSKSTDDLRITVDKDVQYSLVDRIDFSRPTQKIYWAQDICVIEVKFRQYLPLHIANLLRGHNLTQAAISKYSDSVISNYLLT